jgi:hypothetical protein
MGNQPARFELARLDVGLIERIDTQDRAGHGGGKLPAEELLADVVRIGERDAHGGLPGRLERGDGDVLGGVEAGVQPQVDEDAIASKNLRTSTSRTHPPATLVASTRCDFWPSLLASRKRRWIGRHGDGCGCCIDILFAKTGITTAASIAWRRRSGRPAGRPKTPRSPKDGQKSHARGHWAEQGGSGLLE